MHPASINSGIVKQIGDAHDDCVGPTPEIARNRSERDTDRGRQNRDHEGNENRPLGTPQRQCEHVLAEGVGTERVGPRRRLREVRRVAFHEVETPDVLSENRGEEDDGQRHEADHRQLVAHEPAHDRSPLGANLDRELGLVGSDDRFHFSSP
jgi:hypothetical protein